MALSLPMLVVIIGFAGDYAYASYLYQRLTLAAELATDASVSMAAATAAGGYGNTTYLQSVGTSIFKENIANLGLGGATFTIQVAAGTGGSVTSTSQFSDTAPTFFSSIIGLKGIPLSGGFTAQTTNLLPYVCILALDQTASGAITVENNTTIANQACALVANSSSTSAISVSAQSTVAGTASTVGSVYVQAGGGSSVGTALNNRSPVADPYSSTYQLLTSDEPSNCSDPNGNQPLNWNGGTLNLNSGRYCQGFNVNGGTLNFAPGIYYFDSNVNIQNHVTVNGTGGVTIVFSANSFGQSNWNNGVVFNLVAPTTGPTAGFVFAQYANDSSGGTLWINNGIQLNITGAIYAKTKQVYIQSGGVVSTNGTGGCGQIIADTIIITSNMTLGTSCDGSGVTEFRAN